MVVNALRRLNITVQNVLLQLPDKLVLKNVTLEVAVKGPDDSLVVRLHQVNGFQSHLLSDGLVRLQVIDQPDILILRPVKGLV